jgi:hypothetical protein
MLRAGGFATAARQITTMIRSIAKEAADEYSGAPPAT